MSDDKAAWKVVDRKLLQDASPWVKLFCETIELPNGRRIDDFYHVELPDYAVVLALTADARFIMVRGYKHAVGRETLSLPAGMIEPGENPLAAAQRELLEETGYQASHWQRLGEYLTDANRHCGTMHLFVARDAVQIQAPELDDAEMLTCELFSTESLRRSLVNGDIDTLPSAAGLAIGLLLLDAGPE